MKNIDSTYTFRTSISREGYNSKEQAKRCLKESTLKEGDVKMAFMETTISVGDFIEKGTDGHSFCHLYRFPVNIKGKCKAGKNWDFPYYKSGINKGCFKTTFKRNEYFYATQTIMVDIDDTRFTDIPEFLSCLTYKPTITFTSFSDSECDRRFHMVYIFDDLLDRDMFNEIAVLIYVQIEKDTKEVIKDKCGLSCAQYMNGTKSKESYFNNIVYQASDFIGLFSYTEEEIANVIPLLSDWDDITGSELVTPDDVLDDKLYFHCITLFYINQPNICAWFWNKGRVLGYEVLKNNKIDMPFGDKECISTDGLDYYSLPYFLSQVKDGQKRRKKLRNIACGLRKIKPTISKTELFYNLSLFAKKNFDNSDGEITPDFLKNATEKVFECPVDELVYKFNKPKYIVRGDVSKKDIQKVVGEKRTEDTNNTIKTYYNFSKTVKENQKILAENGVFLSESRLYKFLKDIGKKPFKEKKKKTKIITTGYNPKLSIRENMRMLGVTKYQIEKMKKEYERMCKS